MRKPFLTLDPTPDPSAGTPTPPKSDGGAPVKVKIGDKEYDPAEIPALVASLEQAKKSAEEASTSFRSKVAKVFDDSASDREAATRSLLKDLGYKDEEIEEWSKATFSDDTPAPKKDTPMSKKEPTISNTDIEALRETQKRMLQAQIQDWVTRGLDDTLEKHDGLNKLFQASERLRGKEKVKEFRDKISAKLREQGLVIAGSEMDKTGESPSLGLLGKAFKAAADDVVSQFSAAIGDASLIGRSSETVARANPFANKQPAPLPVFKEGMARGDLISGAESFLRDELLKMAHEESSNSQLA